jgi:hypothetical protein
MRSALGKELRKQFTLVMSRTFPQFVETKAPSVWPDARMYVHQTNQASFFIRMVPSHDRDQFRVMFGWSSSGKFPSESRPGPDPELGKDLLSHDEYEFRVTRIINAAGATEDRWWVLEDSMGVAFERTLQEFAKPGDTEIQTLERATSEGLRYMLSTHRETAIEKLLPKIPVLIEDCMQCILETIIPYFEKIKELKSRNVA